MGGYRNSRRATAEGYFGPVFALVSLHDWPVRGRLRLSEAASKLTVGRVEWIACPTREGLGHYPDIAVTRELWSRHFGWSGAL